MKQCPKCSVLMRDHRKFHRHVKDCLILNKPDAISNEQIHTSPKECTRETTSSIQSSQSTGTEKQRVKCPYCPKMFSTKGNYQRHIKEKHSENREIIECPFCPLSFTQKENCQRHVKQPFR